jgi:hypothetical protein
MANKKRGLAAASEETRKMVGRKGGLAYHRSRGPVPGTRQRKRKNRAEEVE